MKKSKNRRKMLRTKCQKCNAIEDSLSAACPRCGNAFFKADSLELLAEVQEDVDAMEALLKEVKNPRAAKDSKESPYAPVDRAFSLLRNLRTREQIPGMVDYIQGCRAVLLPYKVQVLRSTYKANIALLFVLMAFPLLPLILGWSLTVVGLMGLPVVAWAIITYRAKRDLKRAEADNQAANA